MRTVLSAYEHFVSSFCSRLGAENSRIRVCGRGCTRLTCTKGRQVAAEVRETQRRDSLASPCNKAARVAQKGRTPGEEQRQIQLVEDKVLRKYRGLHQLGSTVCIASNVK